MNEGIMLFAGTTEGHALCRWLKSENIRAAVCTATAYGADILRQDGLGEEDGIELHAGRLSAEEMLSCMKTVQPFCIVDATHPYAVEVTANIRSAAEKAGIPCFRLLREEEDVPETNVTRVNSVEEAAGLLTGIPGNILLTTGSKELKIFADIPDCAERVYARVLPGSESGRLCREAGFSDSHVIKKQGPFSEKENLETIRKYGITCLVTKETGRAGGFDEKVNAALRSGCRVISVRRPREEGLGMEEVKRRILEMLRKKAGGRKDEP